MGGSLEDWEPAPPTQCMAPNVETVDAGGWPLLLELRHRHELRPGDLAKSRSGHRPGT